ncbi:hypothetical protein AVDCRST_MAG84-2436, partial [uncultured Microcoleus sp.]
LLGKPWKPYTATTYSPKLPLPLPTMMLVIYNCGGKWKLHKFRGKLRLGLSRIFLVRRGVNSLKAKSSLRNWSINLALKNY